MKKIITLIAMAAGIYITSSMVSDSNGKTWQSALQSEIRASYPESCWGQDEQWGFIGVRIYSDMERFGHHTRRTVQIAEVLRGTPAHRAGLRKGDWILAINGKQIFSASQMQKMIRQVGPRHTLKLSTVRNGHPRSLSVRTIAAR